MTIIKKSLRGILIFGALIITFASIYGFAWAGDEPAYWNSRDTAQNYPYQAARYLGAEIVSKQQFSTGHFITRLQPIAMKGVVSGFFTFNDETLAQQEPGRLKSADESWLWRELDVEFTPGNQEFDIPAAWTSRHTILKPLKPGGCLAGWPDKTDRDQWCRAAQPPNPHQINGKDYCGKDTTDLRQCVLADYYPYDKLVSFTTMKWTRQVYMDLSEIFPQAAAADPYFLYNQFNTYDIDWNGDNTTWGIGNASGNLIPVYSVAPITNTNSYDGGQCQNQNNCTFNGEAYGWSCASCTPYTDEQTGQKSWDANQINTTLANYYVPAIKTRLHLNVWNGIYNGGTRVTQGKAPSPSAWGGNFVDWPAKRIVPPEMDVSLVEHIPQSYLPNQETLANGTCDPNADMCSNFRDGIFIYLDDKSNRNICKTTQNGTDNDKCFDKAWKKITKVMNGGIEVGNNAVYTPPRQQGEGEQGSHDGMLRLYLTKAADQDQFDEKHVSTDPNYDGGADGAAATSYNQDAETEYARVVYLNYYPVTAINNTNFSDFINNTSEPATAASLTSDAAVGNWVRYPENAGGNLVANGTRGFTVVPPYIGNEFPMPYKDYRSSNSITIPGKNGNDYTFPVITSGGKQYLVYKTISRQPLVNLAKGEDYTQKNWWEDPHFITPQGPSYEVISPTSAEFDVQANNGGGTKRLVPYMWWREGVQGAPQSVTQYDWSAANFKSGLGTRYFPIAQDSNAAADYDTCIKTCGAARNSGEISNYYSYASCIGYKGYHNGPSYDYDEARNTFISMDGSCKTRFPASYKGYQFAGPIDSNGQATYGNLYRRISICNPAALGSKDGWNGICDTTQCFHTLLNPYYTADTPSVVTIYSHGNNDLNDNSYVVFNCPALPAGKEAVNCVPASDDSNPLISNTQVKRRHDDTAQEYAYSVSFNQPPDTTSNVQVIINPGTVECPPVAEIPMQPDKTYYVQVLWKDFDNSSSSPLCYGVDCGTPNWPPQPDAIPAVPPLPPDLPVISYIPNQMVTPGASTTVQTTVTLPDTVEKFNYSVQADPVAGTEATIPSGNNLTCTNTSAQTCELQFRVGLKADAKTPQGVVVTATPSNSDFAVPVGRKRIATFWVVPKAAPPRPNAPTGAHADASTIGTDTAKLVWTEQGYQNGYTFNVNNLPVGASFTFISCDAQNNCSGQLSGLRSGTTYNDLTLTAAYENADSDAAPVAAFTTRPVVPAALAVTRDTDDPTKAHLVWTQSDYKTSYTFKLRSDSSAAGLSDANCNGTACQGDITNLDGDKSYAAGELRLIAEVNNMDSAAADIPAIPALPPVIHWDNPGIQATAQGDSGQGAFNATAVISNGDTVNYRCHTNGSGTCSIQVGGDTGKLTLTGLDQSQDTQVTVEASDSKDAAISKASSAPIQWTTPAVITWDKNIHTPQIQSPTSVLLSWDAASSTVPVENHPIVYEVKVDSQDAAVDYHKSFEVQTNTSLSVNDLPQESKAVTYQVSVTATQPRTGAASVGPAETSFTTPAPAVITAPAVDLWYPKGAIKPPLLGRLSLSGSQDNIPDAVITYHAQFIDTLTNKIVYEVATQTSPVQTTPFLYTGRTYKIVAWAEDQFNNKSPQTTKQVTILQN